MGERRNGGEWMAGQVDRGGSPERRFAPGQDRDSAILHLAWTVDPEHDEMSRGWGEGRQQTRRPGGWMHD